MASCPLWWTPAPACPRWGAGRRGRGRASCLHAKDAGLWYLSSGACTPAACAACVRSLLLCSSGCACHWPPARRSTLCPCLLTHADQGVHKRAPAALCTVRASGVHQVCLRAHSALSSNPEQQLAACAHLVALQGIAVAVTCFEQPPAECAPSWPAYAMCRQHGVLGSRPPPLACCCCGSSCPGHPPPFRLLAPSQALPGGQAGVREGARYRGHPCAVLIQEDGHRRRIHQAGRHVRARGRAQRRALLRYGRGPWHALPGAHGRSAAAPESTQGLQRWACVGKAGAPGSVSACKSREGSCAGTSSRGLQDLYVQQAPHASTSRCGPVCSPGRPACWKASALHEEW